jgi:peroxiredoxin
MLQKKTSKKIIKIGDFAPNFKVPKTNGKVITLNENLGKVTLIDFWASWCEPCRIENPNLVSIYKEYQNKGLTIISVSLDQDKAKWESAIAKDQMTWLQVSNLKEMNDPIVSLYGVSSIPSTFLLDAKGKIIAIDLRGNDLKAKIKSMLSE